MITLPEMVALPLKMNEQGAIVVNDTGVTLDVIIACYHQGDTPEDIHEGFDVLPLNDIYAVIAYYIANRDEVDVYLKRRDAEADQQRRGIEAQYTPVQRARQMRLRQLVPNSEMSNKQ